MNEPLSNFQLESALGQGTRTITYSDLRNYKTIEELLPEINSFKIILLRDKPKSGHWVNIIRTGEQEYVYFNSFGLSFNKDLYLISAMIRKMLGSYDNYLNELLKDKKVEYNNKKFQSDYSDVCGRWCVLNIVMITKMLFTLKDFIKFIETKKKELGFNSYDQLVLKLTENLK
jgi:hypothetical protein